MSGFDEALAFILGREGGLSDDPDDRGGRTNYGITQVVYDGWRRNEGLSAQKVDLISVNEVKLIYLTGFWEPMKCGMLPWPVSLCHFDAGVQHSPRYATVLLQRALGVKEDGVIGPETVGAAAGQQVGPLVRRMLRGRLVYYRKIVLANRSQAKFIVGWFNRVLELWDRCIADEPEAA